MKKTLSVIAICFAMVSIALSVTTVRKQLAGSTYVGYTPIWLNSVGASATGLTLIVINNAVVPSNTLYARYKSEDTVIQMADTNLVFSSELTGAWIDSTSRTNWITGIPWGVFPYKNGSRTGIYFKIGSKDLNGALAPTNACQLSILSLP